MTLTDRPTVATSKPLFEAPYQQRVASVHEVNFEQVKYGCAVWNGARGAFTPVPVRHLREMAAMDKEGFKGLTIPKNEIEHKALLLVAGLIRTMKPVSAVGEDGLLASDKELAE